MHLTAIIKLHHLCLMSQATKNRTDIITLKKKKKCPEHANGTHTDAHRELSINFMGVKQKPQLRTKLNCSL